LHGLVGAAAWDTGRTPSSWCGDGYLARPATTTSRRWHVRETAARWSIGAGERTSHASRNRAQSSGGRNIVSHRFDRPRFWRDRSVRKLTRPFLPHPFSRFRAAPGNPAIL